MLDCGSDAAQAVRLINEKPFMSRTLQASQAPVLNRVAITNLQPDVSEDCIVLYLEQRRVAQVDDVEVAVEEFDETNHAAVVSFTDASGIAYAVSMIICIVLFIFSHLFCLVIVKMRCM